MFAYWLVFWCISFWTNTLLRLYRGGNLFSNYWKQMIFCYNSNSRWQHSDNKNFDSPYFKDNLNTPDNMSKNTHTKLFKLQFSGASGNDTKVTQFIYSSRQWFSLSAIVFFIHIILSAIIIRNRATEIVNNDIIYN